MKNIKGAKYKQNRKVLHEFGQGTMMEKPVSTTMNSLRNKPCPCGSRKKFKKCCWSKVWN